MAGKNKKSNMINLIAVILVFVLLNILTTTGIVSRYFAGILVTCFINIVMASSLNLTVGYLGQLALGHAGFMAVGAYASALFSIAINEMGMPATIQLVLSLIVAGIITAIIGYLIGLPALRLKGDYLAIITLGFGEIIRVAINNLKFTGGAQGLTGIPKIVNSNNSYWVTIVVLVVLYTLTRSRHGRAMKSIMEDEIAAEAVGIDTIKFKALGFTISAFFAGVGGGLYAQYTAFLDPSTFGFMKSVEILTIVILGGMGSLTGTVVASFILTLLPELLRDFAEYRMLLYSAVLIIMMIFRPQGILGTKEFSLTGALRIPAAIREKKKAQNDAEGGDL
ncbi:amino acid/amide ABC transporter membrane protein 2 (HAAT family) [Alkalibaculum bacchi]|uniref:Amino acid/amide ABC transporter membrane protein 2 (HAAT family) n=1 Tax=Alkalibaculum bacchi TaxID=645887 RepID=A0A366IGG1_9FIRM|nr:branched-chain amino acid ABC transporter permease [Alkalibaculum bacchi]RBP69000.1 amino acid/amide ABC transporter membrane protein 2 (HAAT family) [Alkalibaculum bacchi]